MWFQYFGKFHQADSLGYPGSNLVSCTDLSVDDEGSQNHDHFYKNSLWMEDLIDRDLECAKKFQEVKTSVVVRDDKPRMTPKEEIATNKGNYVQNLPADNIVCLLNGATVPAVGRDPIIFDALLKQGLTFSDFMFSISAFRAASMA